jgi:hypothetical protein
MRILDLDAHVCPGNEMLQQIGEREPLRADGVHFSRSGARWLAGWLGPQRVRVSDRQSRQIPAAQPYPPAGDVR